MGYTERQGHSILNLPAGQVNVGMKLTFACGMRKTMYFMTHLFF